VEVVRLGAFADYETEDEYREHLRDSPLSTAEIAEALASFRRQFSIGIEEFAILADGRRLVFDRQGFSWRVFGFGGVSDPIDEWALLTVEEIEEGVRNTVLPDDDETAAEHDHDWWHIAICHRGLGVAVSPEELMGVPTTSCSATACGRGSPHEQDRRRLARVTGAPVRAPLAQPP
jgi:hypothetical protein